MIGVGAVAIVTNWPAVSATVDEPLHIACGLEWLDRGTYTYQPMHPPLARVAVALGPYLEGERAFDLQKVRASGHNLRFAISGYSDKLTAARIGTLPFFALACWMVVLWARRWFSGPAAIVAVLLFVSLPPVLAHAGLATTDMACTATVLLALYAFLRCMEDPTWARFFFLGVSLALAFLCKFSSLAFLGMCFLGVSVYLALDRRRAAVPMASRRRLFAGAVIVSGTVLILLWAGYRFSVTPLADYIGANSTYHRAPAGAPLLRRIYDRTIMTPIPLAPMVKGIRDVVYHNADGLKSYLLGEYRRTGWWYFFPIVVGVKTPIGFLILVGFGAFTILRAWKSHSWPQHFTLIFPVAITLVCMSSRIDLGVRHILPIYPLMAIIGAHAISEFHAHASRVSRAILVIPIFLVAWVAADSWIARPDYLAYFNPLAGAHPERILAESDLDWGQDLGRLSERLKQLRVDHVAIKYFGTAPLEKAGLPPYSILSPKVPTTHGYVAISVRYLTLEYARDGSFAWLQGRTPHEIIGKSIYLYNFGP